MKPAEDLPPSPSSITHENGSVTLRAALSRNPLSRCLLRKARDLYVSFSLRCHPGAIRTENQDRVMHGGTPFGELFIVADGVGGHANGAEAAGIAVREYVRRLSVMLPGNDPEQALLTTTRSISEQIARSAGAAQDSAAPAMASTVALVLLQGATAYVGHLGDSRVYLLRTGDFSLLTRDHSVVQRMVDTGILSPEQAQMHPQSHVLTQCLGQPGAELEIHITQLLAGDTLLLCSDGLWAYVEEHEIAAVLREPDRRVEAAADALQAMALAAGAPDNLSIVLLRCRDASSAADEAPV